MHGCGESNEAPSLVGRGSESLDGWTAAIAAQCGANAGIAARRLSVCGRLIARACAYARGFRALPLNVAARSCGGACAPAHTHTRTRIHAHAYTHTHTRTGHARHALTLTCRYFHAIAQHRARKTGAVHVKPSITPPALPSQREIQDTNIARCASPEPVSSSSVERSDARTQQYAGKGAGTMRLHAHRDIQTWNVACMKECARV